MKTTLSTTEAAQVAGCSAKHIQNLIKRGKMSASRDDRGSYVIDKSEFYRVFPETHKDEQQGTQENKQEDGSRMVLEAENKHLREMNEFLKQQLENFTAEKKLILETLSSNQKLLEHKSSFKRKKVFGVF